MSSPALVVIPTYDEADNIVAVLDRVRRAAPQADVLVVDDLSPDGTGDLVRGYARTDSAVHLLVGSGKAGLGAAYRTGFRWALDRGYAAVVQMDADLSHPPERVPALLEGLEDHDVVVGSRYVAGGAVSHWPWSRRLVSRGGNAYARLVLGLPVHDVTAGFKAFRRDALVTIGALDSVSDGYCFQVENTWQAARSGLRIAEVPITFVDRTQGESKMSAAIALEAMRRVLVWRWELVRRSGEATHRPQRPTERESEHPVWDDLADHPHLR
jgi:dolichol-phosphate mannosyltransferase